MAIQKCLDCYGEKLKLGDEVIPVLSEAAVIGIKGVISKIEYSEKYDDSYITISDHEGNALLSSVNSRYYTTQERFYEREIQNYVYELIFYNKRFWPLTFLPLTNKTDMNYEIPDETCLIALRAEHFSTFYIIYDFVLDGIVEMEYDKEHDDYYLCNFETYNLCLLNKDFRMFKSKEDLQKYVQGIIEYFNQADLTFINDRASDEKEEKKNFERKLIRHLKD